MRPRTNIASAAVSLSVTALTPDDIVATHRELKEKDVRFEDEPHVIAKLPGHDLWMTFARDSEGNVFALMSEVTSG